MRDTYEAYAKRKEKELEDIIKYELTKQKDSWNDFVKTGILTMFIAADIPSAFFVYRNNLRKRSNASFDERIYIKAPNNIKLRFPVALKLEDGELEAYDPYGSVKIKIEKKPEYELVENRIYILTLIKRYPMHPFIPVLEENVNGVECHLKPTTLPLRVEPEESSDYAYLRKFPKYIGTETEAIDVITEIQNYYRLKDYYVERRDAITIIIEGEEDSFILFYSPALHCIKIAIMVTDE